MPSYVNGILLLVIQKWHCLPYDNDLCVSCFNNAQKDAIVEQRTELYQQYNFNSMTLSLYHPILARVVCQWLQRQNNDGKLSRFCMVFLCSAV